ncbi:MAG TPA: hypothetical protein VFJ94_05050 [Intrasporangium sp.]|uniref:mannitol dehydrogenase family protein n=1 Tax=Intrasporangium sp. TaxID=1925024 RepID=UPI002D77BBDA|nr:hypothetical protein [Intrasporangium sp.]HET7397870.1 hypothetical protein [Intrasporangium sp.]
MSAPLCVVAGAGRLAAGYVAPLLAETGWQVVLVSRSREVVDAVQRGAGLTVAVVGPRDMRRWIGGVQAMNRLDPRLPGLVAGADLVATSVGPGALCDVGTWLGPLLRRRLDTKAAPLNVVTFENHRRAPELLAEGLLAAAPSLAGELGRRLGLAGSAVWSVVSRREVEPGGLTLYTDGVTEAYVDRRGVLDGVAPLDGSVPGLRPVEPFDAWMAEKLWLFNGGHAAAAYLGFLAGCATVDEALARPRLRAEVRAVLAEAAAALGGHSGSPSDARLDAILTRYADPALADPVTRVAREPRRKLAPGDRLIGPAVAARGVGVQPAALARVAAAALAYREPSDPQAVALDAELRLLGPAEVLATISQLHPSDELSRLVCASYHDLVRGA